MRKDNFTINAIITGLLFCLMMGAISATNDSTTNYNRGKHFTDKSMSETTYLEHLEKSSK
jgi:hypothetical protein